MTTALRLLMVEDYALDAALLTELLALLPPDERPCLTHVSTVAEALERLRVEPYDCVLLDLGLPDGDGVDNVTRIRAAGRHAPIVVMTGLDDEHRAIESLRLGAQEYLVKGRLDQDGLMRHLRHAIQRNTLISDLDQQREQQQHLAAHDPLTGLANRQHLSGLAREALRACALRGERLALSFLDLDGFKGINDRLGHAAGDAVLIRVARTLQGLVRDGDTVARLGGDEFVVLQAPAGSEAELRQAGQRLVEAIAGIGEVDGQSIRMGASMGIAIYPDHGDTLEQLLLHADEVMYAVKRGGGGALGLNKPSRASAVPATDAAALLYQPWIGSNGEPGGVEVLLRERSGHALLAPEDLLATLGRSGSHSPLTMWVLHGACGQWVRWRNAGLCWGRLAVNLPVSELRQRGFAERIADLLDRDGVSASELQIEIAEHALESPTENLLDNLHALRRRGVRVVMDRFGRDSGSLRRLIDLPLDGVKLDHSVVSGLGQGSGIRDALVVGTVNAARTLGMDLVAVGVEHEVHARHCLRLQCSALQGRWLVPPVDATRLIDRLKDPALRERLRNLSAEAA